MQQGRSIVRVVLRGQRDIAASNAANITTVGRWQLSFAMSDAVLQVESVVMYIRF
jgi:hypothetical protein